MNKGFVKTLLLLLIIPVIICIVISVINLKKNSTPSGFSTSTNYGTSTTTNNTYQAKRHVDSDIGDGELVNNFNKNYTILFISSIVILILFIIFYLFLNKKKEW